MNGILDVLASIKKNYGWIGVLALLSLVPDLLAIKLVSAIWDAVLIGIIIWLGSGTK